MSLLHKGNMTDRIVFMLLFSVTQPGCERENALSRFSKKHPVCFCLSIVFCGFFLLFVCVLAFCFLAVFVTPLVADASGSQMD